MAHLRCQHQDHGITVNVDAVLARHVMRKIVNLGISTMSIIGEKKLETEATSI